MTTHPKPPRHTEAEFTGKHLLTRVVRVAGRPKASRWLVEAVALEGNPCREAGQACELERCGSLKEATETAQAWAERGR